ncbi:MAG: replication protein, partial [Syntrophomonadaceae bacterium]
MSREESLTQWKSMIQWDGPYTRIGTCLLEALPLVKLNRTQQNICIFLWRRTYGWNRTRDSISLADFTTACGCCKEYISRQLKILMEKHIIRRVFVPGRPAIYSFVADVTEWEEGCIDLEALERNRESGIYQCAPEEMTDLAPYPEALWSDQTGDEEVGDLKDGSTAVGEEAGECPFMEGNWLTDCEAEEREEKFRQAVQQLISRLSPA